MVTGPCEDIEACFIWSDDFEGYPTGTYIAVAGAPDWNTWIAGNEGTEMDSQISDEASVSGTQSMKIFSDNPVGGPMDVVYVAGETGQLELSFNLLVAEGHSGYYNFQENAIPGLDWAFECTISADGTASFLVDSDNVGSFALGAGWHNLSHLVDTENDRMNIYKDGAFMLQLPYDGLELGGVNFYAAGDTATLPLYYVDDMELYEVQPLLSSAASILRHAITIQNPWPMMVLARTLRFTIVKELASTTLTAMAFVMNLKSLVVPSSRRAITTRP